MSYRQLCLLWSFSFRSLYIIPYKFSSCLCLIKKKKKLRGITKEDINFILEDFSFIKKKFYGTLNVVLVYVHFYG